MTKLSCLNFVFSSSGFGPFCVKASDYLFIKLGGDWR